MDTCGVVGIDGVHDRLAFFICSFRCHIYCLRIAAAAYINALACTRRVFRCRWWCRVASFWSIHSINCFVSVYLRRVQQQQHRETNVLNWLRRPSHDEIENIKFERIINVNSFIVFSPYLSSIAINIHVHSCQSLSTVCPSVMLLTWQLLCADTDPLRTNDVNGFASSFFFHRRNAVGWGKSLIYLITTKHNTPSYALLLCFNGWMSSD